MKVSNFDKAAIFAAAALLVLSGCSAKQDTSQADTPGAMGSQMPATLTRAQADSMIQIIQRQQAIPDDKKQKRIAEINAKVK